MLEQRCIYTSLVRTSCLEVGAVYLVLGNVNNAGHVGGVRGLYVH